MSWQKQGGKLSREYQCIAVASLPLHLSLSVSGKLIGYLFLHCSGRLNTPKVLIARDMMEEVRENSDLGPFLVSLAANDLAAAKRQFPRKDTPVYQQFLISNCSSSATPLWHAHDARHMQVALCRWIPTHWVSWGVGVHTCLGVPKVSP